MEILKYGLIAVGALSLLMAACANDGPAGPAVDTAPPNPPVGLEVTGASGDLVRVTWQPNAEPDLAGYRVYRASGDSGEFSQISTRTLVCPWFYDHVTPMGQACFKVTAVDESGNESAFSQAAAIYLNDGWRNPPDQPRDPR